MQLNFLTIIENISYIAIFLPIIIFVKILIIFLIIKLSSKKRTAFKTALSLFQIGEFAIVVFELASAKSLIDNNLAQILVVIIILSMILTPFVLRNM
jgi:CPA2 family monovalent cation:H+ antiporter-2